MTLDRCPREDELLDALGRGFVGAELAAHVEKCLNCTELNQVAGAVLDEHRQAMTAATLPSSGTMLWRMQMRHRQEAQATARRSLIIGQALTLAFAIALVVSLLGTDLAVGFRDVITSIRLSTPMLSVLGTWLLLSSIAGYVALKE